MSNDSSPQGPPPDIEEFNSMRGKLDLDTIFDILSHPYRWQGLAYLLQNGKSASADDLYDHMAGEVESVEDGPNARTRVKAAFHHCHWPKLEAAELIVYDEGNDIVRATEKATTLKPHLEYSV